MSQPFRTPVIQSEEIGSEPKIVKRSKLKVVDEKQEEVPFTLYQSENKRPFVVDFYDLGEYWDDIEGGFSEEIGIIEGYFKDLAEKGVIENTTDTIKTKLKQIEKVAGIDKTERKVVKLAKLASYITFLKQTDDIDKILRKYGSK